MSRPKGNSQIDPNLDLSPYKVEPLTTCWWCDSPGPLTSEHKFKQADLKRMADGGLVWGTDGLSRDVRSVRKSREARFPASLCAPCNNQRSQPFDRAYQEFSEHMWETPPAWDRDEIDMGEVFGDAWATKTVDLARYFAKHIGCRIAADGYAIPPSLAKFMDGGEVLRDVQMVLFKSAPHHWLYEKGVRDGVDSRGLWIEPAAGSVSPARGRLCQYSSGLVVNYVGVFYRWELDCEGVDPFYLYRRATLWPRHELPEA